MLLQEGNKNSKEVRVIVSENDMSKKLKNNIRDIIQNNGEKKYIIKYDIKKNKISIKYTEETIDIEYKKIYKNPKIKNDYHDNMKVCYVINKNQIIE